MQLRAEAASGGSNGVELGSREVFKQLAARAKDQPDIAKKINATYVWVITKDGKEAGRFTVDLKAPNGGEIYEGGPKEGVKPGVTLTLSDDNMVGLVTGKLNPQQAFMSGKLKIKGNIMLTQKLQALLKDNAKL